MLDGGPAPAPTRSVLLIGTTNLDARVPVIWNIGVIAASGRRDALKLVHKILLASSAIPAAFPPVLIDVKVDGESYQEMHVDGGAIAQLFLYPPSVTVQARAMGMDMERKRRAFIIRNARLRPGWGAVERSTLSIAEQAISTLIYMSGINDLYRVYFTSKRDGVDYNLAFIGDDFEPPAPEGQFDPIYMKALFAYGYEQARRGCPWGKTPPFLEER